MKLLDISVAANSEWQALSHFLRLMEAFEYHPDLKIKNTKLVKDDENKWVLRIICLNEKESDAIKNIILYEKLKGMECIIINHENIKIKTN